MGVQRQKIFRLPESSTFAVCSLNKLEAKAESKPANAYQEEYALNPCDRKRTLNDQFSQRLWEAKAKSKPANAFQEEYALNLCDRKRTLNDQFSQRKRHKQELLSLEAPYKSPVDKGDEVLNDLKGRDSSTRCSEENIASYFSEKFKARQAQSSYTRRHANGEAVVLVDEEEPDVSKATERVDQVVERKATKIYYPSRFDPESVEICCSDMESLAPEAYLSSTIMNFYIR
ncbi:hypothetical protein HAX54_024567 [Datura stramonium]|uniref:Uncharacterized protein n=1 Tax=Datura stramonium TaxID=4076 RepID=A0ABS8UZ16_DATST|nr:hypothetical protein [Datura stramonium]